MSEIEKWESRREERLAREAAALEDQAFQHYEEDLKKAQAYAVIKTEDPLQHTGPSIRDFHIRWATRLQRMAGDRLVAALGEAAMVKDGL